MALKINLAITVPFVRMHAELPEVQEISEEPYTEESDAGIGL